MCMGADAELAGLPWQTAEYKSESQEERNRRDELAFMR